MPAEEAAFDTPFEGDARDAQRVGDYAVEVHAQYFHEEVVFMPRPGYMADQADLNGKMRAILVDWLVEVHLKYCLRRETLFLCINLVDRYLSIRPLGRKKLQLLGVACMLIATKFEEIHPPKVAEFAYITDNTYTTKEIQSMECTVLTALHFQIVVPTVAHFFDRLIRANGSDKTGRDLTQYILELALIDIRQIRHVASHLLSAAILLSNELLGHRTVWPPEMVHHSRCAAGELQVTVEELRQLVVEAPKSNLQAVRRKYQSEQFSAVGDMAFNARPSV